jgi:hypothetical protein
MAVLLVTYDLRQPGRNYQPVFDYLQRFTNCKGMESVWLLDTTTSTETIRNDLMSIVDANDRLFVVQITRNWASFNYVCAAWLNDAGRNW